MTSQLRDRPIQVLTPAFSRNEPPSRSRLWVLGAAAAAVLTLGAGLIVAEVSTDGSRSVSDLPQQAVTTSLGVNGALPAHLQEFEARLTAVSSNDGVLPAHLDEFEARLTAGLPG